MASPHIKMISVSNVFSRLMLFENAGDIEIGHCHVYDHATLISWGSVRFEILDGPDGNTVASKDVQAPNFVFVAKDKYHRLTALEPKTVCACIHALRDINGDLISPEFLINQVDGAPDDVKEVLAEKAGVKMSNFCVA